MSLLPGYVATITVNAVEYAPTTMSASLDQSRNPIQKTKLGETRHTYLSGLGDATCSLSLHMDTDTMSAMMAAYEAISPVSLVLRPGALGTMDVGQWAGTAIVNTFTWSGDADGEWDVQMDLQATGDFVYTQPA